MTLTAFRHSPGLPVVVYMHGGGWVVGTYEYDGLHDVLCAQVPACLAHCLSLLTHDPLLHRRSLPLLVSITAFPRSFTALLTPICMPCSVRSSPAARMHWSSAPTIGALVFTT